MKADDQTAAAAGMQSESQLLLEQHEFLQAFIDSIPSPIFYKSLRGIYLGCNKAYADWLGRPRDEIVGKTADDLTSPSLAKLYRSHDEALLTHGGVQAYEAKVFQADGAMRHVLFNKARLINSKGCIQGIVGIILDITERKDMEQKIREQREILNQILNAIPHSVFWKDADLVFLGCNDRVAQMAGFQRAEELIGKKDTELPWRAEETEYFQECDRRVIESGKPLMHIEECLTDKEGSCRVVLTSKVPMRGHNGEVTGVIGVFADITELKQREKRQRELEKRIEHVQKLESLGALAGGVAHDFNNLLGVIIGNTSMALTEAPAGSFVFQCLSQISQAAERAAELTDQMLAYSGRGQFVSETMNLAKLLEEMQPIIAACTSKKADIKYLLEENVPDIEGDPEQIKQVIVNLLTNASEALEDRCGDIAVRCEQVDILPSEHIRACTGEDVLPGSYVSLQIKDSGCGMDKRTLRAAFEPFFSTKFLGRGLGLSATLGIVRGHKGAITVSSNCGTGTLFTVYLPIVAPEAHRGLAKTEQAEEQPAAVEKTILIADDEQMVLSLSRRIIEKLGFKACTAENGRKAVEVFREYSGNFSLVLLDLTMPELDGEETLTEMRKINPGIRALFSSGYSAQRLHRSTLEDTRVAFIKKPYHPKELSSKIRQLLENN